MTSQKAPHVPGTPSLREKIAIRLEENGDSDVDGLDCVRTPSAPLHNTFDDLEKLWSSRKSSIRKDNVEDSQGISSSIKSEQTQSKQKSNQTAPRTGTLRKKKVASSVEIIGSPDLIFPTTPKEPALTQSIRSKNSSVFDRLYQKGKSKVATARLRELDTSTSSRVRGLASPSASSIGGTTVSTLSSADSNFERLFKGEKRKNRFAEEHHAASAVLERRLSYTNPGNKNRTRPTAPRTSTATDERSISTVSTTTSSVFDRLYTKDKRPTPSLTENANFRKSRIQSPRSRHKSNKSANNSLSETPIVRGSRRRENLGLDGDSVIESVADFSERWHNDEESLLLNTSAFNDYELIHQFHLLATEISSKQENTATFADSEYELFSDLNQYTPCQVFTASESNENEEGKPINEQRKEMDLPEVSIYSKIRLGVLIGEFNTNAAAMAIQKVWKGYRGRTELVNMLLLSWQIRLDYNASTTSNRISLMRIRLQSLSKAAEGVELTKHIVLQQVEKSAIHLEWKRPVLVHFQRQEIPRLESVVVVLTCGACRPLFIKNWSTSNMANLVVKLSLRRISQLERDSLMAFSALLIQCQARKMYAKKISAIARCRFIDTKISFQLQDISSTSLACCAATSIQNLWRSHRAQLDTSAALLRSWSIEFGFKSFITTNRILLAKVKICSLSKALGRVDYWWITERIKIGENDMEFNWQREIGVHFNEKGFPRLESCEINLKCLISRSSFAEKWGPRKLAILVVKASLEQVLRRDVAHLRACSASKIQNWLMRSTAKLDKTLDHELTSRIPRYALSTNGLRSIASHSLEPVRYTRPPCNPLISHEDCESAAITIQSPSKLLLVNLQVDSHVVAATVIQSMFRYHLAGGLFRTKNSAANRMRKVSFEVNQKHVENLRRRNIVVVQSLWRRKTALSNFTNASKAIILIQVQIRRRQCKIRFAVVSSGIVLLQSQYRGVSCRTQFLKKKKALAMFQSLWRAFLIRRSFITARAYSVMIQSHCRRYVICREYQIARVGVLNIQSHYRGHRSRKAISQRDTSVLLIQRNWRGHRDRLHYKVVLTNQAATVLQKVTRRALVRAEIHRFHRASIKIQCFWRRFQMSSTLSLRVSSVLIIQACTRGWKTRRAYALARRAIISFQSQFRCSNARHRLFCVRMAAIQIQTIVRAYLDRQKMAFTLMLAGKIQRRYRCHRDASRFVKLRFGLVLLQAMTRGAQWRGKLARRRYVAETVQRLWRGYKERLNHIVLMKVLKIEEGNREASNKIQSLVRSRRFLQFQTKLQKSANRIQSLWRMRNVRHAFLVLKMSATMIQSQVRRHQTCTMLASSRHTECAAISIQKAWRSCTARLENRKFIISCLHLQARYRGVLLRRQLVVLHLGAQEIQRVWRGQKCRQSMETLRLQEESASTVIQSVVRRRFRRDLYLRNSAACVIQTRWRSYHVHDRFLLLQLCAVKIQTEYRRYCARKAYTKLALAVAVLQSIGRRYVHGTIYRRRIALRHMAATRIQSLWRLNRRIYWYRSAASIQSLWRMRNVRHAFLVLKMSATMIQSQVRRHQTCTMLASSRHTECAAISIQKAWRSCTARLENRKFIISCLHLQARYRGVLLRRQLVVLHLGAQEIQRVWRGQKCRQSMETLRLQEESASTVIQSVVRRRFRRDLYLRNSAACAIQTRWRSYHVHDRFLLLQLCAVKIQTEYRRYCARKAYTKLALAVAVLQSIGRRYVHGTIYRRRIALRHMAATRIQSLWRLYPGRALNDATSLSQTEWLDTKLKDVSSRSQARLFFKLSCRQNDPGFSRKNDLGRSFVAAVLIQVQWRLYLQRMSTTRPRQELFIRGLQEPTRSWTVPDEIDNHWAAADRTDRKDFQSSKSYCQLLTIASSEIAAISIQSACRRYLARKAYFQKFRLMHSAARRIQVGYLTWQMELILLNVQSSVVLLRRSVRGQLVRSATRFALDNLNTCFRASTSTSFGRIVAESCQNEALCSSWTHAVDMARESACVVIQSAVRRTLARNRSRFVYRLNDGSMLSPIFTSLFSWSKQRSPKEFLHHDDTCLEVAMLKPITSLRSSPHDITVVMTTTNVSSRMMPEACANVLAVLNESECHDGASGTKISASTPSKCSDRIVLEHAATKIQSTYRGFRSRRRSFSYLPEIIKLQSFIRTQLSHTKFRSAQFNATQIQRYWKEYQRRLFARKMHDAAITIQLVARAVARKRDFDTQRAAALSIQAHFRVSQDRLRRRSFNLKLSHAVISLQKLSRRAVAMAHFAKVKASITKVQARFRGMVVRVHFKRLSREKKSLDSERLRPIVEMLIMSDVIAHAHNSLDNLLNESSDFMGLPPPCVRRLTKRVNALPRAALRCTVHGRFETSSEHMSEVGLSCPKEASPTSCNSSTKLFLSRKDARSDRLDNSRLQEMRAQLIVPRLKALPTLIVKSPSAMEMKNSKEMANQSQNGAASKELARATQSLLNEARAALHGKPKTSSHDKLNAFPLGNPRSPPKGDDTFDSENFGDDKNEMPSPIKEPSIMETWDWADHLM